MVVKALQNAADPSRVEVGEIDTSAPFASVKAAVSMFGETSASPEKPIVTVRKPKPQASESPLAKERQLHLAQRELNKFKDRLNNYAKTRIQALNELENDKKTVDELQQKLKTVNESKDAARKVTEDAKTQIKDLGDVNSPGQFESSDSWKQELESAREQYAAAIKKLELVKQELRRVKKDLESSRDAKNSAIQQEAEAKQMADINRQRAKQLSEEMASIQESIVQVKLASSQSNLEESDILSDKDTEQLSYKLELEESQQKLSFLRQQYDPELAADLDSQLEKITSEIESVQKQLEHARASDLASIAAVANRLEDAKAMLQMVMEEESSLRSLVETVKLEIENTKKIQLELRRREEETETLTGDLEAKLKDSKVKLDTASAGELKVREAYGDLISILNQLSVETENTRKDAELMKRNTKEIREETEAARVELEETEKQLHVALVEAEMAKAAETDALNQIKVLSEKANLAQNSTSDSGARITISHEEFESLGRKVEESETLSETKVAAALAQIEALKASEQEANKKLEAASKEIVAIDFETEIAVKRAETSEAAMRAVEGEMKKLREVEQKRAEEAAARSLAEMEVRVRASPPKVRVPRSNPSNKPSANRMMRENSHAPKKALIPNLVSIFHKKKNQPDVASPSYVSGEKPGLLGVLD